MQQLLLYENFQQFQAQNRNICRLCLGKTPQPINPCKCTQGYIHEQCLKIQISKQLKYHNNSSISCRNCHKIIEYQLIKKYRFRNCQEIKQFVYENILPQIIMCLLLIIALMLNQHCLKSVKSDSFWMKVVKVYLVLVGVYLEFIMLFVIWIMYESCKEELCVKNYQVQNIKVY